MTTTAAITDLFAGHRPDLPVSSRIYDHLLGGKDNFQADRDAASQLMQLLPNIADLARANRSYAGKAVTDAGLAGIRQFIDLGCGMPSEPDVHQTAAALTYDARVVYVDADPLVLCHARACGWDHPGVGYVEADLRNVPAITASPEVTGLIDPKQPVCLLACASLHWIPGDIADVIGTWKQWLPSGSWLVITHVIADNLDPRTLREIHAVLDGAPGAFTPRRAVDVYQLSDGFTFRDRPAIMGGGPAGMAVAAGIAIKPWAPARPGRAWPGG